jgi:8-oxo-dGTP pyrophosphatase MutT (NUDIX family)
MPEEEKKWKREFSAGGIVYRKQDGQIFVLLIMAKGPNYGPPTGVWSYPKGHIEGDETSEIAARREVREETGVDAEIKEDLGSVKYFVHWGEINILKFVKYFLMQYQEGSPKPDEEISEVKWFALKEAEAALKYKTDLEVFAKAKKFLQLI